MMSFNFLNIQFWILNIKCNPLILLFIFTSIGLILVFKIKDYYKFELQAFEFMNIFGGTKILIGKTNNGKIKKFWGIIYFYSK